MTPAGAPGVPEGYRDPSALAPVGLRPVTHLTWEIVVIVVLLAALSRELLVRAPHAFLSPLGLVSLPLWTAGVLGASLGSALALRGERAATAARALALAALAASLLPWGFRWGFALALRSNIMLLLVFGVACASLAHASVACVRWLARDAREFGVALDLLSPSRLAQSTLLLAVALAATANLPALHAGGVLGICLSITSLSATPLSRFLCAPVLPGASSRVASALALGSALVSVVLAERALPLAEARAFVGQVVSTAGGTRQRIDLVSFGSHFELYVDRALRVSQLDQERYPEALVHPARLAVPGAKRALLLGGGTGLVERELLRASALTELAVVVTDRALSELVASAPFPGAPAREALADPRVTLIEAEPVVFVDSTQQRFELVVLDVDEPIGYREGKHFTRHFYRSVRALLTPGGVMVAQLPSPLTFPEAYASVLTTLAAAELDVVPYRAALPALGEWGFALASPGVPGKHLLQRILDERQRLPQGLAYLTPEGLVGLFALPRDLTRRAGLRSTLPEPSVVELYARENTLRE